MIRKMGSFRTYVGLEEYEMKQTPKSEEEALQPNFLNGEIVISEALNVLKFTSLSKRKGLSGSLFVTNARVIFVSSDNQKLEVAVPLLSINTLWYYEHAKGSAGAKKHRHVVKLGPSSMNIPNVIPSGSTRVHEILIACSSFKTLRFSFKFSPIDHGLRICNSIIHHSFPLQLELLFYFDYSKVTSANWRQSLCQSTINVPSYLEKGDWLKELNITRCNPGYRISNANENFELCGSLPEWIVVPADLIDVKLRSLAEKLKGNRPPHWSWADCRGAGILRMSKLNSENDCSAENAFFEVLRKTHPKKRPPEIFDLDKDLPVKEIRQSFIKLFELCCPESYDQYEETDSRFYSLFEQTKWLILVSKALHIADSASSHIISDSRLIILQEHESRDTTCLCSSLIQIIVEPRFRTVTGFFSLIQKEWIAFGHPFHSAYMHASPIFLMFLDCVHQLMRQNIVEFEFNDKLLAQIWSSCFEPTRGTFLFDTPQQRKKLDRWNEYTAWGIILSDDLLDDTNKVETTQSPLPSSFNQLLPRTLVNPMFKLKSLLYPPKLSENNYLSPAILSCSSSMCDLQFWTNLYLSRTLNATMNNFQFLGGNDVLKTPLMMDQNYSPATTESPELTETTFVYPLNTCNKPKYYSMGRDPGQELKLVEVLLAALSSSTRQYLRQSPAPIPGLGRRVFKESGSSATVSSTLHDQHHLDERSTRRNNPFSYK